jgi:hypothetical protein
MRPGRAIFLSPKASTEGIVGPGKSGVRPSDFGGYKEIDMNIVLVKKTQCALLPWGGLAWKMVTSALLLLLIGYGSSAVAFQSASDEASILAAYNAAIYDSSVYKFSNLRPLTPLNFDASKSVSVVTLTSYDYQLGKTTVSRDVWVTAVPEVQQTCRGFSGDLELRLRQFFGLHPNATFTTFVVMKVKAGDIFRPTANPDPTTTLPCACPIPANCGEAFPETVSDAHIQWFANQMLNSYVLSESSAIPMGYPWTRLGYTYDWKPGANKYGASEYVIRKNSTVNVTEMVPYKKYCGQAG